MPSMNPDGFEEASPSCYPLKGRYNKNGADLTGIFLMASPVSIAMIQTRDSSSAMDWIKTEDILSSANLHGGSLVAS
uniref:Uncharacterized protein n=1 Tax=Sphaerodactylus townsendi TaxID=933632 RepID=A0ACB8FPF7_9SAUR